MTRRDWLQSSAAVGGYLALASKSLLAQGSDDGADVGVVGADPQTTEEDTWMSAQGPVASLLPHQSEGGLVTDSEMGLAQRWAEAVASQSGPEWLDGWLNTALPFSFRYDGADSADVLDRCEFDPGE